MQYRSIDGHDTILYIKSVQMEKIMQKVNITELRSNLPLYLAHVRRGRVMQITHRGKVIARIVPEADPALAARERLVALRSGAHIGDVISPLDESWEAARAAPRHKRARI